MKLRILGLVAIGSLGLAGCDEEAPVGAPARKAAKADKAAASAANVSGRWEMDAEGFVDENWELLSAGAQKGLEPFRKERERIATLRVGERIAAEQALEAKINALPTEQREAVKAALGTPEEFKAWARTAIAARMTAASVSLEFFPAGGCRVVMSIPGKDREDAKGTWTQQGERVVVKMATVNGKAAKGKDALPVTMVVRGDRLTFTPTPGAPKIVARRAS